MRILFLGDVMGRAGRRAITERLGDLRARLKADLVIVNAENASGGRGATAGHAQLLLDAGADALTLGDHAFDQKDMMSFIEREPRVIRPLNFAREAPGRGATVISDARGRAAPQDAVEFARIGLHPDARALAPCASAASSVLHSVD